MPGSLRISTGSHRCERRELGEFQSGKETSRVCSWLSVQPHHCRRLCKTGRRRVSFLTLRLVPSHCSADSSPGACLLPRGADPGAQARGSGLLRETSARSVSGTCDRPASHTGRPWGGLPGTSTESRGRKRVVREARPHLEHWFSPLLHVFRY